MMVVVWITWITGWMPVGQTDCNYNLTIALKATEFSTAIALSPISLSLSHTNHVGVLNFSLRLPYFLLSCTFSSMHYFVLILLLLLLLFIQLYCCTSCWTCSNNFLMHLVRGWHVLCRKENTILEFLPEICWE